jgi:RNA polymerase sigma factor (TIGR02999 family)
VTSDNASEATRLLGQMNAGEQQAAERLLPLIYEELHKLAGSLMARERADHTLQPTALVNEAYVRLIQQQRPQWESRVHFVRVAARAMRNVLVDHARARRAQKRGKGFAQVTLDEGLALAVDDAEGLLVVDETLNRLRTMDEQLGEIVELRFFGGLTDAEIGAALGISERSVQRGWRTARAWLSREMAREERSDAGDTGEAADGP